MKSLRWMATGISLGALVCSTGCDKVDEITGNDEPEDALVGSWDSTACYGQAEKPPGVDRCSIRLDLEEDLDVGFEARWESFPAAEDLPGCTTIRRVKGLRWSADHTRNILNVKGTANATIERTGCVNGPDDVDEQPTQDIQVRPSEMKFELRGDSLTITEGDLAGTYTR